MHARRLTACFTSHPAPMRSMALFLSALLLPHALAQKQLKRTHMASRCCRRPLATTPTTHAQHGVPAERVAAAHIPQLPRPPRRGQHRNDDDALHCHALPAARVPGGALRAAQQLGAGARARSAVRTHAAGHSCCNASRRSQQQQLQPQPAALASRTSCALPCALHSRSRMACSLLPAAPWCRWTGAACSGARSSTSCFGT